MEPMLEKMIQIFNNTNNSKSSKPQGDVKDSKTDVKGNKTDLQSNKTGVKGNKTDVNDIKTNDNKSQTDGDNPIEVVRISSDRGSRQSTPLVAVDPGNSLYNIGALSVTTYF